MTPEITHHHTTLLESLHGELRLLAEAHVGLAERLDRTRLELGQQIQDLEHQIIVVDVKLAQRIEALAQRVERVEARLDAHDRRFDAIEVRLGAIEARLGAIEARLDAHDRRFDAIEARLDAIEARLDAHDRRFDAIEARLDAGFGALSAQLTLIASHLGIGQPPPGAAA